MQRWQIGGVRITRVVEIEGAFDGEWVLGEAVPENVKKEAWLRPRFANDEGKLLMSIHALVIESEGKRIVVDTCVGNDKKRRVPGWNDLHGPFLRDLAEAGFPRESIDFVLCTHLHVDHVGWNTMLEHGRWVPTFPKARYLFGRKEWDFWSAEAETEFGDPIGDSVRPVVEAGRVDLVGSDHAITGEVRLESTPGHTPGHVSVRIASGGREAIITGDVMHHPVQCARPEWASNFDSDAEAARRTRRAFLERTADRPILIIGTHFATPTAGHVVRAGGAWRFEA